MSRVPQKFSDFYLEPRAFDKSGDTVFMHGEISAWGMTSETIHLVKVIDGKVGKCKGFDDTAMMIFYSLV